MGADRKHMDHLNWPIEPLCRKHHMECHNMPQEEFDNLWHIVPVEVDKAVARAFKLKAGQEEKPIPDEEVSDEDPLFLDERNNSGYNETKEKSVVGG